MMWWLAWMSAYAMTVQEAVDAAVARTPVADVSAARVAEAEARVREARGTLLPTVSVTGAAIVQRKVEADVPLPDGLPFEVDPLLVSPGTQVVGGAQLDQPLIAPSAWAAQRAAASGLAATQAQVAADELSVARGVVDAWHLSAEAHAVHDDAARFEQLAADLVAKGDVLVELGVAAADQVIPFRRAQATARANLAVAESASATADGVLQQLTGLPGRADVPDVPGEVPDLAALLERLDRPDVVAARARAEAAEAAVAVQRGALWPVVGLQAGVTAMEPAPDIAEPVTWRVAVGATVPLFQGGRVGARVDQASARGAQARAAERAVVEQAQLEVRGAHGALASAVASLSEQDEAVRLARQAVAAAETRVDEGAGTLLELQQAQADQIRSELLRTRARAQAARARDRLSLATTGTL